MCYTLMQCIILIMTSCYSSGLSDLSKILTGVCGHACMHTCLLAWCLRYSCVCCVMATDEEVKSKNTYDVWLFALLCAIFVLFWFLYNYNLLSLLELQDLLELEEFSFNLWLQYCNNVRFLPILFVSLSMTSMSITITWCK